MSASTTDDAHTRTVTTVVSRVPSGVEQVRYQAVFERTPEREDVLSRSREVAGREEQSSQRDKLYNKMSIYRLLIEALGSTHDIPTPTSSPSRSKMRQPRRETRHRPTRTDTSALHQSIHLYRAQSEIMHKAMTCRNELGTLRDDGSAGRFVG